MSAPVTVGAYNNPLEAHLARGRLEAEGNPASLAHERHVWANWLYSQALGGAKVQVPAEYAERAARVRDAHNKGEYEESPDEALPGADANVCPRCGSGAFRSTFSPAKILLVLLSLGLAGVIFPPRRECHVCARCGHHWRY